MRRFWMMDSTWMACSWLDGRGGLYNNNVLVAILSRKNDGRSIRGRLHHFAFQYDTVRFAMEKGLSGRVRTDRIPDSILDDRAGTARRFRRVKTTHGTFPRRYLRHHMAFRAA